MGRAVDDDIFSNTSTYENIFPEPSQSVEDEVNLFEYCSSYLFSGNSVRDRTAKAMDLNHSLKGTV